MTDQTDSAASSRMLAYQAISTEMGAESICPASGDPGLTAAVAHTRNGSEKNASDAPCTNLIHRFS